MISLKPRRNFIDAHFVHKLLNGFADSSELLQKISLDVPQFATCHFRSL